MPRSICSAPGKVILFGEHAVVYGVTAIAAALSDLRIVVQLDTIEESYIEVNLQDLLPQDTGMADKVPSKILHSTLLKRMQKRADPLAPICPNEDLLKSLQEEFSSLPLPLAQGLMAVCFLTANILPELLWGVEGSATTNTRRGIRVDVRSSGLPVGAGLGSSASFSVALSGALLRLRQLMFGDLFSIDVTLEDLAGDGSPDGWAPPLGVLNILNGWAYASEVIIHGEPSGLDNTTSCFGGAVRLNRSLGRFETLPALPDLHILITNTRVPRSTRELVAKVRSLHESMPTVVQPILESIEGVSQVFLGLLDSDPAYGGGVLQPSKSSSEHSYTKQQSEQVGKIVGNLFNVNHHLLCSLGVGHSSLTMIKEASLAAGLACKLTGAGGGGCAITLLESRNSEKVKELRGILSGYGYDTFLSKLGGVGVKWHSEYPKASPQNNLEISKSPNSVTTLFRGTGTANGAGGADSHSNSRESLDRNSDSGRGNNTTHPSRLLSFTSSLISFAVVVVIAGVILKQPELVGLAVLSCLAGYLCNALILLLLSSFIFRSSSSPTKSKPKKE